MQKHRKMIEQLLSGAGVRINGPDPWDIRYIFPNGMLPSIAQIGRAAEGLLITEDIHNLGPHYEKTLLHWNDRFQASWHRISGRYDQTFKRMWEYYFLTYAGAFRARSIQIWQIVMTKVGTTGQPWCRFA
jgi:cyclopropane-fatty-acyl-phospholipid synthase